MIGEAIRSELPAKWRFGGVRFCGRTLLIGILASLALGSAAIEGEGPSDYDQEQLTTAASRPAPTQQQQEAAAYCAAGNFTALYGAIEADLRPWRDSGIPAKLMDSMLAKFGSYPMNHKGVGITFKEGKPYIITDTASFERVGHHKKLIAAHLALFAALSATFGPAIPDVELLVGTADEPSVPLRRHDNGTRPASLPVVLRFCKSDAHADLMVPDIHFFMRNFTGRLLSAAANFSAAWPWERKRAMLFGRFSPYKRAAYKHAPALYRRGKAGRNICKSASPELWFCDVRKHFIWEYVRGANRAGAHMDVAQQPKRDMLYHASHKLLLHLDGQTCSSRLEQLLVLGSCVVKEESGYRAFFHHLLQPYQHYVPFWKELPEEAADVMDWAAAHDAEAAAIAGRAQVLATTFLHKRALMCYWLKMLQGLAVLLRYRPGPDAGDRRYPAWLPLAAYMEEAGTGELERHGLAEMEFWE